RDCRLQRVRRRLFRLAPRDQRVGHRRVGQRHGARLRFRQQRLRRRSARSGGDRPQRRRAHDPAARRPQDADLPLPCRVRSARGTASPPSPAATNIWIEPGSASAAELMGDIKTGFYVTELMGMGVNGITGDYSRGAAGFWIENGQITHPVSEMTVAGNLNEMFARMTAANDLEFRTGADSPTLRIDDLTVAGA